MKKQISAKRALLMSALALVLCVSMLVGSTFAWFTDSVVSGSNIIKSGTLDVTMEWADGKTDPADTTWTDASTGAIFNNDHWEPGYTEVRHVRISNVGTLALKYVVNIKANGAVSALADVIDVYFVDPAAQVEDRTALSGIDKIGTLSEVLAGEAGATTGDLTAGESDIVTIALKMQENAGNEYQDMSIGSDFSVQVLATQMTSETDSFDDQYDLEAATYVTYDASKTAKENGTALQAAIDAASEGDVLLVGTGTYYAPGIGFSISKDNLTLIGENGAVLAHEKTNADYIMTISGDNVTIRNFELNKNYNESNQVILAYGAENLTVNSCDFYGKNTGNTPTMGIYMIEQLDNTTDEKNDAVTKYTITNNTFNGAAIGAYKGGSAKVTTDPGVITASVSADMVIKNNTFIGSSILIEGWRSWRTENTRDHEFVPTIKNNNFVSPNLCFDNTPHSIYLRCYREGNPDKILPAGYIDAFIANNTVATPSNGTVTNYQGADYVLSDAYGCFYRDNATYGIIAYCYGQSYGRVASNTEELRNAISNGDKEIHLSKGEYSLPTLAGKEGITIIGAEGAIIGGESVENGFGSNFGKNTTIKNVTFFGTKTGARWTYAQGGTVIFENCAFLGNDRGGFHIDESDGATLIFNNCTLSGFNAFAGDSAKVVLNGCTLPNNGKYNGLNMYCDLELNDCKFEFTGKGSEFIDFEAAGKSLTITNCTATMNGVAMDLASMIGGTYVSQTTITIDGVPVEK